MLTVVGNSLKARKCSDYGSRRLGVRSEDKAPESSLSPDHTVEYGVTHTVGWAGKGHSRLGRQTVLVIHGKGKWGHSSLS